MRNRQEEKRKGWTRNYPRSKERLKGPRFNTYTSLSMPQAKIQEETHSANLLFATRKKPTPPMSTGTNIMITIDFTCSCMYIFVNKSTTSKLLPCFIPKFSMFSCFLVF